MADEGLIEAVAVEVMMWHKETKWNALWFYETDCTSFAWKKTGTGFPVFDPLTDMNHAWIVIEKMRELGFTLRLGHGVTIQGILTWVKLESEDYKSYYHDEIPGQAICLAAREAIKSLKKEDV